MGQCATYGTVNPIVGQLKNLKINVKQAAVVSSGGATIDFDFVGYDPVDPTIAVKNVRITINTLLTGVRNITQAGRTGFQTGDAFILDPSGAATPITAFPVVQLAGGVQWALRFAPTTYPFLDIELLTDTGMLSDPILLTKDYYGASVTGIVGPPV